MSNDAFSLKAKLVSHVLLVFIKEVRKASGLKQDHLASVLGIRQSAYSRMERGVLEISLHEFFSICFKLNVQPDKLYAKAFNIAVNIASEYTAGFIANSSPEALASIIGERVLLQIMAETESNRKSAVVATVAAVISTEKTKQTKQEARPPEIKLPAISKTDVDSITEFDDDVDDVDVDMDMLRELEALANQDTDDE